MSRRTRLWTSLLTPIAPLPADRMIVYNPQTSQVDGRPSVRQRRSATHGRRTTAGAAAELRPLQPQTMVDLVIDAIVPAAAAGVILPGDRIVEADLARKLGVSRVPVREALRLLESQGIVINEPYRGIRLRPVTNQRVDELIEARVALEASAVERAVAREAQQGRASRAVARRDPRDGSDGQAQGCLWPRRRRHRIPSRALPPRRQQRHHRAVGDAGAPVHHHLRPRDARASRCRRSWTSIASCSRRSRPAAWRRSGARSTSTSR